MNVESWLAFVAAAAVLLVIPGPSILAVISYSLTHGRAAALPLIAAVALGDSTALAMSVFGLGTLLATSAVAFTAIKWAGAAYLVYLGVKMFRAGATVSQETTPEASHRSRRTLFLNTYAVTATNPKGILFYLAFLPQFIDPAGNVASQIGILAITFVALATINATFYALFAAHAARLLASKRTRRWFNFTSGSLLSTAGIWVALGRRAA